MYHIVNNFNIMIIFILYSELNCLKYYQFVKCLPIIYGGWCNVGSFHIEDFITQGHIIWFLSFTGEEKFFLKILFITCYIFYATSSV